MKRLNRFQIERETIKASYKDKRIFLEKKIAMKNELYNKERETVMDIVNKY